MKTKRINVFDQTPRKIVCISKTFDYFGDGTLFTEDRLEVGTFYTLKSAELQPYGSMVHLQEIESKYGFQDFLFEELEEYELELYESNYEKWLQEVLEKGMEDVEAGRAKTLSVSEARKRLRERIGDI